MSAFVTYFRQQRHLGSVAGIPVMIDNRWFPLFLVLFAITAFVVEQTAKNIPLSIFLGFVSTLLYLISLFLHELAHVLAARNQKLKVVEMILHPFGGLSRFSEESETPQAEFQIALAGPAASFILTLIFTGLMAATGALGTDILAAMFFLLALSNFMLAMINLFPGYPLDGGRMLRAYLWKSGKDLGEATIVTAQSGRLVAAGLAAIGVLAMIFYGEYFPGFLAVVAGLFLYDSATAIIRESVAQRSAIVDDVMRLAFVVQPDATLQSVVDDVLPLARDVIFPVALRRQFYGMLRLNDLNAVSRSEWRSTLVRDIMLPVAADQFVDLGSPLAEARSLMRRNKIGAVAVTDAEGNLVGVVRDRGRKRSGSHK